MRKYPGLQADHWALHERCPRCRQQFKAGDETTLIPLAPDDPKNAAKMRAGRPYTTPATLVHWDCATPQEQAAE